MCPIETLALSSISKNRSREAVCLVAKILQG